MSGMFSAEAIIFAEYLQKQQWFRLREAFNLVGKYDIPIIHPRRSAPAGRTSRRSQWGGKGQRAGSSIVVNAVARLAPRC